MQVFLPSPDFETSLAMLDGPRLRKQRVEAFQLINVILGRTQTTGWKNHPAAVMFRQYAPALQHYYNLSLIENARRGGNNVKLQPEIVDVSNIQMPHWLGDDSIHRTHRSRLLMKGKIDVLADRIRRFTGVRGVNEYLKNIGYPSLNEMREVDYVRLTDHYNKIGVEQSPIQNYYSAFGWTEPDTLEYLWPGEFPGSPNKLLR